MKRVWASGLNLLWHKTFTSSNWNKHHTQADTQRQFSIDIKTLAVNILLIWTFCLIRWQQSSAALHLWPNVSLHHLLGHEQSVIRVVASRAFPRITWFRELCWCTCELSIDLFASCSFPQTCPREPCCAQGQHLLEDSKTKYKHKGLKYPNPLISICCHNEVFWIWTQQISRKYTNHPQCYSIDQSMMLGTF